MAFNASNVKTRYSQSGNIPVLKEDFTKLSDDLIAVTTFMKTGASDAGKFTTVSADGFTMITGNSAGAWPANIRLADINTGGLASSATNGHWNTITIATGATAPATNISVQHLKRVTSSFTATASLSCPAGGSYFITSSVPTHGPDDGGSNIQFFWVGSTGSLASYGGGSINISGFVVPGRNCTDGTAGQTKHAPIFFACGTNSSGTTLALNQTCRMYSIAET